MYGHSIVELQQATAATPWGECFHPTGALYEIPLRLVKSFPSAQGLAALR